MSNKTRYKRGDAILLTVTRGDIEVEFHGVVRRHYRHINRLAVWLPTAFTQDVLLNLGNPANSVMKVKSNKGAV